MSALAAQIGLSAEGYAQLHQYAMTHLHGAVPMVTTAVAGGVLSATALHTRAVALMDAREARQELAWALTDHHLSLAVGDVHLALYHYGRALALLWRLAALAQLPPHSTLAHTTTILAWVWWGATTHTSPSRRRLNRACADLGLNAKGLVSFLKDSQGT